MNKNKRQSASIVFEKLKCGERFFQLRFACFAGSETWIFFEKILKGFFISRRLRSRYADCLTKSKPKTACSCSQRFLLSRKLFWGFLLFCSKWASTKSPPQKLSLSRGWTPRQAASFELFALDRRWCFRACSCLCRQPFAELCIAQKSEWT